MNRELNRCVSVDCVIFGLDQIELKILLLDRILVKSEDQSVIFRDKALPGNHIHEGEDPAGAAKRILFQLSGITNIYLEQFATFGSPDRLKKDRDQVWLSSLGLDPRKQVVTIGYVGLIRLSEYQVTQDRPEDYPFWYGKNPQWYSLDEIPEIAFDHGEIISAGLDYLRNKSKMDPIVFKLLPYEFSLPQLQGVIEAILGIALDKRNFRRKILKMDFIVPLAIKQTGVTHKPAYLYRFDEKKYIEGKKKIFNFCGY